MTYRSPHKNSGVGFPCTSPSVVPSKRIAAMTLAVKRRRRHNAHAHLMHKAEHFGIIAIGGLWDAVEA
jgi:hypothetical protein